MQGHHAANLAKPHTSCQVLAVVVVVNSVTLTHYQRTDLGYSFVADFHYRLIRESLIFCHIFSRGNGGRLICGTAYTRVYTISE